MSLLLYSSSTCPAGVRAAEWLAQQGYAYQVMDYDQLSPQEQHSLLVAQREFMQDDQSAQLLPLATSGGQVVAVGFSQAVWQETLPKQI